MIKFCLFFIVFFLGFLPLSKAKELEINSEFSILTRIYPIDQLPYIVDENLDLFGLLEIKYKFNDNIRFYARERLLIDPLQRSRNRYEPLDFYLDFIAETFDFRFGQMVESFAIVDTFNPVDILNRRDPQFNFYDPAKLGDLMTRLRLFLPESDTLTNNTVSFYFLPLALDTPLPANNSRFRFSPTGGIGILDEDNSIHPSNYANRLGYAAKLSTVLGPADFFALYYGGPSRIPSFFLDAMGFLNPVYYRIDLAGGGFQWAIDKILLKGELAYTWTDHNGLSFPYNAVVPDSYLQFVFGFDYTFEQTFFKESITITLEYAGEGDHDTELTGLRPYKNDLIIGLLWDVKDLSQTQFRANTSVDLGNGESLIQLVIERKIWKELKALLGGTIVVRETQEFTPWGIFPNNSSINFGFSYAL